MYADSNPALLQGTVREYCLVCQGKSKDIEGDGTKMIVFMNNNDN